MFPSIQPLRPTIACLLASLLGACGGVTPENPPSSTAGSSSSGSASSGSSSGTGGDSTSGTGGGASSSGSGGSEGGSSPTSSSSASGSTSSSSGSGTGGGGNVGAGTVVMFEDFNSVNSASLSGGAQVDLPSGLGLGAQHGGVLNFDTDAAQTYGGQGKSLKASYPVPTGDVYAWGGVDLAPYNTESVYVRFRAKMPGKHHGLKFIKVFGQNVNGAGYANTTFGLDYTGVDYGGMYATSFGDGTALANDTANVVNFDGSYPTWIGRSYGLPGNAILTPQGKNFDSAGWGSEWHLFELHVKFNSGTTAANEKNDGELFVRIDGKVDVDAKGLFNRNYLNKPLASVEILGWSQTGSIPFDVWYDNIEVSINDWGNSPV